MSYARIADRSGVLVTAALFPFQIRRAGAVGRSQAFFSKRGTARAFWYCYAVPGKVEINENNRVIGSSH
jgi:hypothetical protein